MDINEAYKLWRGQLATLDEMDTHPAEDCERYANQSEKKGRDASLIYVWAANKYLHKGDFQKFKDCLLKAAENRSQRGKEKPGVEELSLLAGDPKKTWELCIPEKDITFYEMEGIYIETER